MASTSNCAYDITGPSHQGRVVFGNLNIKNANPKAEEIGRQQLGDIMRAIGLAKVTDTDQFIGGSDRHQAARSKRTLSTVQATRSRASSLCLVALQAAASIPPRLPRQHQPASAKAAPPWAKK
jgi:hypothetical protein